MDALIGNQSMTIWNISFSTSLPFYRTHSLPLTRILCTCGYAGEGEGQAGFWPHITAGLLIHTPFAAYMVC